MCVDNQEIMFNCVTLVNWSTDFLKSLRIQDQDPNDGPNQAAVKLLQVRLTTIIHENKTRLLSLGFYGSFYFTDKGHQGTEHNCKEFKSNVNQVVIRYPYKREFDFSILLAKIYN